MWGPSAQENTKTVLSKDGYLSCMCQGLMSFENVSGCQTPQEFKKIKGLTKVKADV